MALVIRQPDPARDGTLEVEEVHPKIVEVYFVPPEHSLIAAGYNVNKARSYRTKLLGISSQDNLLTIYPIGTFGDKSDFLKPKYGQVERITLHDTDIIFPGFGDAVATTSDGVLEILERLPSAFTKDYAYGLGLAKPYRFIINAVEKLSDCIEIIITGGHATGCASDGNRIFYIAKKDFEQARAELNKIDRHTQSAARAV